MTREGWPEFRRGYRRDEWAAVVLDLKGALRMADKDGLVVNPLTENLILGQEEIRGLKEKQALADSVRRH